MIRIKIIDLKSKENKKRALHLKDWSYSKYDIPVAIYHANREKLKEFKNFTKDDKLSILNDRIFKAMFYDDKRLKIVAKFISLFFDVTEEEALGNIKFVRSESNPNSVQGRVNVSGCVMEIYDSLVNIEMNRTNTIERNVFYLDKLADRKNIKGKKLKVPASSFQINFCDFLFEGHNNSFEFCLDRDFEDRLLTFNKQYVMIFVQNIWKKYYNKEELSYREKFILVLASTKISVAKKLAKGDKFLMEVIEEMERLKTNNDITEAYDIFLKEREGGREEGLEEGIEKGLERKQNEIVKNMYDQGFSIETISKVIKKSVKNVQKILGLF